MSEKPAAVTVVYNLDGQQKTVEYENACRVNTLIEVGETKTTMKPSDYVIGVENYLVSVKKEITDDELNGLELDYQQYGSVRVVKAREVFGDILINPDCKHVEIK